MTSAVKKMNRPPGSLNKRQILPVFAVPMERYGADPFTRLKRQLRNVAGALAGDDWHSLCFFRFYRPGKIPVLAQHQKDVAIIMAHGRSKDTLTPTQPVIVNETHKKLTGLPIHGSSFFRPDRTLCAANMARNRQ